MTVNCLQKHQSIASNPVGELFQKLSVSCLAGEMSCLLIATGEASDPRNSKHTCVCLRVYVYSYCCCCCYKARGTNRKVKVVGGHFCRQFRCRDLYFIFLFLTIYFFFVKRNSICAVSDQICYKTLKKILKTKFTNSDDNL